MKFDYRFSAVTLVLALACGCENPADNVAKATVGETVAADTKSADAATDAADTESLPINPKTTTIEFVGSKVTGSHDGGFKKFDGTFHLDPAQPEESRLEVEIEMDSTWSDSEKLTRHLKNEDFFHVEKFPTAKFESTKIEPAKDEDATHAIAGNLTLHGVTKPISFPATLEISDAKASLKSEFSINRQDFGIEYSGQSDNLIRDEVVIRLAIEAPREDSA